MRYDSSQSTPDLGRFLKSAGLSSVVENAAETGADAARAAAPYASGDLAASIHVENMGLNGDRVESRIVASADHSAAKQWGNARSRAEPYMEAAIAAIEDGA